jgi:hypothetical protein
MSLKTAVRVPLKDFMLDANMDLKKAFSIDGNVIIQGNDYSKEDPRNPNLPHDIVVEGNTLSKNTQTLFKDSE